MPTASTGGESEEELIPSCAWPDDRAVLFQNRNGAAIVPPFIRDVWRSAKAKTVGIPVIFQVAVGKFVIIPNVF